MRSFVLLGSILVLGLVCLSLLPAPTHAETTGKVFSAVDVKLWGRTVFHTHFDTAIQAQDFMSYLTDESREETIFNPRDTRFGFRATVEQGDWTHSGVVELDFYGSNASNNLIPRLRLGYAEAKHTNGFTIRGGQDWIPVAQQNPGTIDFGIQSWSGNLWWRVPQFTVRYKVNDFELLGSAMKHRDSNEQEIQEKMPWVLGRIALANPLGEGSLLAVGGGFRISSDLTFEREASDSSVADYNSHLVALELKAPLGKGWVLVAEAYTGQGIGREFVHYGLDYNPWHPDGGREIQSKGGFASLKIPGTEKVHFNAGYGFDNPEDDDLVDSTSPYLKNQSVFANVKHAMNPQFGWGFEFTNFTTTQSTADGTNDLVGQRYTAAWWFIF